jgi:hypothetical protein
MSQTTMKECAALTKNTPSYQPWNIIHQQYHSSLLTLILFLHFLHSQTRKPMYHHANIDINLSQSSDHASISTKSSETRRKQIPLAFTNTWWGREYIANQHWEQENLGKSNVLVRQRSGSQNEGDGQAVSAAPSHSASTIKAARGSTETCSSSVSTPAPPTTSPTPPQTSQQYSVMTAWNFFRHTFPQSSPTSDPPDTEKNTPDHADHEEEVKSGPWLEMLMRWDDFEQWQLKMLQRSWCLPGTP